MENKVKQILVDARNLLAQPGKWIRGALAKTKGGYSTSPAGRDAQSWCSIGAINKARQMNKAHENCDAMAQELLLKAIDLPARSFCGGIAFWNDQSKRRKKEVIAAFDKAIELAGGENGK